MHPATISGVRAALVLAILILVCLIPAANAARGLPAPEIAQSHAGSESISISVNDHFQFQPQTVEVTPGDNVTLTITQIGTGAHTFTLSSVANFSFASSTQTSDLVAYFQAHPPLVNLNISATTGSTVTKSFVAPTLGVYEFVCLQVGHFGQGMYGLLGSGVNPSPLSNAEQIPVGVFIIVGVIVGLVVLAIVLGFVVGKREGARYEMPPERLGYSEPAPAWSESPRPPT